MQVDMTMEGDAILISSAVWMLVFRKLSSWIWFKSLRKRFPSYLEYLWEGWTECAYCGGFWIALLVRAVTKLHTVSFPMDTPLALVWILDALVTAIGVLLVIRILDALGTYIRVNYKEH